MFEAITGLIPGVAGVAGVLGAGYGIWKKRNLAKLVKAVFDVIQEYRAAKDASGAGGTDITKEEMDGLIVKLEVAAQAAIGVIRN